MPFEFEKLEKFLVCPASKSPLLKDGDSLVCTSAACRLRYAIRDDIPVMLVDEAESLPVEQWEGILRKHGREPNA